MPSQPPTRERVLTYTAQGLTPREIARILECSVQNVYLHLKHAGVKPAQATKVETP